MADPAIERMLQMIRGYRISQVVGTLAALGIPDRLAEGPLTPDALADEIGCHCDATYRLLRAAASLDIVSAVAEGQFGLAPLGERLRSNVQGSLREFAIAMTASAHWLPWGRLIDSVRQGQPQAPATLGRDLFDFYAQNPDEADVFTGAMSDLSRTIADEVAGMLDTSTAEHVVDVGGASGAILAAVLKRNPSLRGTILELPHVVPQARAAVAKLGLSPRCEVAAGDFFKAVPPADIHVLKLIIHDWDDERSKRILSNCAGSLRPNGRVVLVERVLAEGRQSSPAPLDDLNMLVLLPGRERTGRQYGELLKAAGLRLDRIMDTSSGMQVIEARAAS